MDSSATIAAIATAASDAGIGIVRLSGKDAIRCADLICTDRHMRHTVITRASNTIRFACVRYPDGTLLDEALVSVMRAPNSYTGEDVAEINVHGGYLAMTKTLSLVLETGKREGINIRLAEPGEFTKRAFLNGKMDLSRAEAVQDLIAAQNDFALQNAARQLGGALFDAVGAMRKTLLHEAARIEATFDDPDAFAEELSGYGKELSEITEQIRAQIQRLLLGAREGKLRRDGIRTAITGAPNTGKSTLLNGLLREERAIVTAQPGTTRDILEERCNLGDLTLVLSDTAGIRETADEAEKAGVIRARQNAKEADLILFVADCTDPVHTWDTEALLPKQTGKVIVLLNKADLLNAEQKDAVYAKARVRFEADARTKKAPVFLCSFREGQGIAELESCIRDLFLQGAVAVRAEYYLTGERHAQALREADESLCHVQESIRQGMSEEVWSAELMLAAAALAQITGEDVSAELIDTIFADFCMGK